MRTHPLLRQQETSLKKIVSCKRCQEFSKSFVLYQYQSEGFDRDLKGFNIVCQECKDQIEEGGDQGRFIEENDENRRKVYFFYDVSCFEHSSLPAKLIDLISLLPICKNFECDITQTKSVELNYSTVESLFFNLLKKNSSILSSDRIKRLISHSLSSLLSSCRWLDQLQNGVFCQFHPKSRASMLDKQLRPLCSICSSHSRESRSLIDLSYQEASSSTIIESLRAIHKSFNPLSLNKFILQVLHLPKLIKIDSSSTLNLLILEVQDFLIGFEYPLARCVFCLRKASLAQGILIELKCGHLICFKCLNQDYSGRCIMDSEPLVYEKFFKRTQEFNAQCHFGHDLQGPEVWKLPCFHYSCLNHLKGFCCFQCGFSVDLWPWSTKRSEKIEGFLKFFQVNCQKHRKKVKFFQMQPFELLCEDCEGEKTFFIEGKEMACLEIFRKSFEDRIQVETQKAPGRGLRYFKDIFYCNTFLKSISYFNLMTLNHQHKTCLVLDAIQEVFSSTSWKNFLFFRSFYPKFYWSTKAVKFVNNTKVVLSFSVKKDVLLKGFIISACYLPYSSENLYFSSPFEILQKTIELDRFGNEVQIIEKKFNQFKVSPVKHVEGLETIEKIMEKNCEILYLCEFEHLIYLNAERARFEFWVVLKEGFYYYSKAFTRFKNDFIEWTLPPKKSGALNAMISSPVLGISLTPVNHLLTTEEIL